MGELSLTKMALELLQINENFCSYVQEPTETRVSDFELYTFVQIWGSTATGFGGIGGQVMTAQRTYVFIPICNEKEKCLVFFSGRFAYAVPYSRKFMDDVRNGQVESVTRREKYFE